MKSIFESKTFWLNVGLVAIGLIQQATGIEIASAEVEALVSAVLNIAVRFATYQPVSLLGK